MIFISPEQGSADLAPLLRKQGIEVPEPLVALDYADAEFTGRGVKGKPVSIGVEVKRLQELTSDWNRLAGHQIPKMIEHYDYRYLIYEGKWKQNRKGTLLKRAGAQTFRPLRGRSNASSLRKQLYGLSLRAGVLTYRTEDRTDTIRYLVDLYRMWTDDNFEEHRSHLVVYEPQSLLNQSDFCRAVAAWPHVGLQRARAAEKVFKSVRHASMAHFSRWAAIETIDNDGKLRKIGTKTAMKIEKFLEGETTWPV